jgi:hypothetical protein
MSEKNKKLRFTSGFEIHGESVDITEIIETLYQEIAIKSNMNYSFQDMRQEINNIISQLSPEDRERLLSESIFLNTITYENQMMEKILKKLSL